jgi:formiminotetrahydrofolate cyclodeaminase
MTGAIGTRTVAAYLDELASAAPAPGGAVAALHAAQAAALVRMVCNLTIGRERFAAAEQP